MSAIASRGRPPQSPWRTPDVHGERLGRPAQLAPAAARTTSGSDEIDVAGQLELDDQTSDGKNVGLEADARRASAAASAYFDRAAAADDGLERRPRRRPRCCGVRPVGENRLVEESSARRVSFKPNHARDLARESGLRSNRPAPEEAVRRASKVSQVPSASVTAESSSSFSETSSRARWYRQATFSGLESSIVKLHEPTVVCRRQ